MKRTILYSLLTMLSVIFFQSCKNDDYADKITKKTFEVTKFHFNDSFKGGDGEIMISVPVEEAKSLADWLTVTSEGDKIKLKSSRNEDFECRNTKVIIRANGGEQFIPIQQMGVISDIQTYDTDFIYQGETVSMKWNSDLKYEINGLPKWMSYKIDEENNKIQFTAEPIGELEGLREADIEIIVPPLTRKQVHFRQFPSPLSIDQICGDYEMVYKNWFDANEESIPAKFIKVNDRLINIQIGNFIVQAAVKQHQTERSEMELVTSIELGGQYINVFDNDGNPFNKRFILYFSPLGEGGVGYGWNYKGCGLTSLWNGDKENIEFQMVNNGVLNEKWEENGSVVKGKGFFIYNKTDNKWDDEEHATIGSFGFITFKKKA